MVVVLNFSEQMGDTRCIQTKEKGRAETLPYKMFIKSNNLFHFSPNQWQYPINHFLNLFFKFFIPFHSFYYYRTPLVIQRYKLPTFRSLCKYIVSDISKEFHFF